MCNRLILPLIKIFKKQDMSVFPIIYEDFKKLIQLYAAKLRYEDAAADLNLFFVELLYGIDLSHFSEDESFGVKRYIAVCLRNHYIALSVKYSKLKQAAYPFIENVNGYAEPTDDKVLLSAALSGLSSKQKAVLIHKYIYGYSDFEISQKFGISRQAVNGVKRRALAILREYIKG